MKNILSFGGGWQTTAMVVLGKEGIVEFDEVVFADTGAERPETYWYIENYIKPLLEVPFVTVRSHLGGIYDYCWEKKSLPSVHQRWCTDKFKVRPIEKRYKGDLMLIGFSADEIKRAEKPSRQKRAFPLIEKGITANDCVNIIKNYGLPIPLRSSCYICVFEPYKEWNWLKTNHPELMEKALALEQRHYERYPHLRDSYGLLRGTPLWKIKNGLQPEMLIEGEYSCWSGYCGH
jgi:hypothetical protein